MQIILKASSMIPLYEQIVNQIKSAILEGALAPDEALPSVRGLSNELRISALTVKKAYDFLEEDGYVVTVHGKGTFVAAPNLCMAMEERKRKIESRFAEAIAFARAFGSTDKDIEDIVSLLLETDGDAAGGKL